MVAPSVPHTMSLQKAVAASTKAAADGAVKRRLGHLPEERLHVETDVVGAPGRHARDEGPGQRVGGSRAELLGLGMGRHERVAALRRTRVVGAAGGDARQRLRQRAEEGVALGPGGVRDDEPGPRCS